MQAANADVARWAAPMPAGRLAADRPTGPAWITPGGAVTPAGRLDPAWLRHTAHHRQCYPLRLQAAA